MNSGICILCGKSLDRGATNLEHYLPQVLLRNFHKLKVSKSVTHALRTNRYGALSSSQILPLSRHKAWATIRVHKSCNLDASGMCRDLKWIVDHLDTQPTREFTYRIREYYGHLWSIDKEDISVGISDSSDSSASTDDPVYRPGSISLGCLCIWAHRSADFTPEALTQNDQYHHTIYLGTEEFLKKIK